MKNVNKKTLLAGLIMASVAGTAMAGGVNNIVNGGFGADAVGNGNTVTASATSSFAVGWKNTVSGGNALVLGSQNTVKGDNSFAGGNNSKAEGRNTFAFGSNAEALTAYTYAIGSQARTNGTNTVAVGNGAYASNDNAISVGASTVADGKDSLAFGSHAEAHSNHAVAIGTAVITNSSDSVGIGHGVTTSQINSVAVGNGVVNTSNNSIGIGNGVTANTNAVAIGNGAGANNINTIAIGNGVNANSTTSIAIGYGITTDGNDAVNIGNINKGATKDSVLVGAFNNVNHTDHLDDPTGDVLLGNNNTLQDGYHGIIVGKDSTINNSNYAIAIGNGASVAQDESVAIGHEAKANTVQGTSSIVVNGETHNFAGTTPVGTVSVGDAGRERTITNVAAGRISNNSTDTINGSQLYAVISELETTDGKVTTLKDRVDRHDQRLGYLQDNITDQSARITAVEKGVKANTTNIANNAKTINDHSKVLANHEQHITTLEGDNKELKNDVQNTQNQVNINTKDIADLKGKIGSDTTAIKNELNSRISQTNQRMNKLGASSAALAGLHPLEYNKNDKGNFAISYGHYRNANAVALGAFYSPNEKVRLGFGITLGGETQFNINAAFRTGKGSEYEPQAKNGELEQLRKEVAELKALVTK